MGGKFKKYSKKIQKILDYLSKVHYNSNIKYNAVSIVADRVGCERGLT